MDKDTIYRQMAIDAVNDLTYPSSLVDVKRKLVQLPSAQPERKKGKWICDEDGIIHGHCSCCGFQAIYQETDVFGYDFCPQCGADMRGEQQ